MPRVEHGDASLATLDALRRYAGMERIKPGSGFADCRDERGQPRIVSPPPVHDGLRRALKGSFSSVSAVPDEFTRLLRKLD